MKKIGSTEWTIGKLLTFVLLIVFLILVVYGISTGGFKPLIEKVSGQIDSVLILFHIKDDNGGSSTCNSILIKNLDGGNELLNYLKLTDESAYLEVCKSGSCTMYNAGADNYFLKNNALYNLRKGEKLGDITTTFNSEDIEKYFQLFNGLMNIKTSDDKTVKDYFLGRFTEQFILKGERKDGSVVYAVWGNGQWIIERKFLKTFSGWRWGSVYVGQNNNDAINAFSKIVESGIGYDYIIKYTYSSAKDPSSWKNNKWLSIDYIIDGDNSKIDNEAETSKLKEFFNKHKNQMVEATELSEEKVEELKQSVNSQTIESDGKNHIINTITSEVSPYFEISLDDEKYRVMFNGADIIKARMEALKGVDYSNAIPYFADFFYADGSFWQFFQESKYLHLPKNSFDTFYKNSKIKFFMQEYC
jgi:hypothetical protein